MTSPTVVALCLGGTIFVLCIAAVTCFCYRRRRLHNGKRHGPDQPLAFHTHRRPTAVKSPAGSTTHYLKKSPSPTGPGRTPPGVNETTKALILTFTFTQLLDCSETN